MRTRFLTEERVKKAAPLDRFARARGHTLLELAFSWLAAEPTVASVIAGASTPDQVRANARAAEWTLSAEELGRDRPPRSALGDLRAIR